jgi:hypothetical protein
MGKTRWRAIEIYDPNLHSFSVVCRRESTRLLRYPGHRCDFLWYRFQGKADAIGASDQQTGQKRTRLLDRRRR